MNLFQSSRLALTTVAVLCTLHACASDAPGDDDATNEESEKTRDAAASSDDDEEVDDDDDLEQPPRRDAGSSATGNGKDAAYPADASTDTSNDRDARSVNPAKDTGVVDATARADAEPATPSSDATAAPALPDLFGDGGLFAPKIPGPPSPDNPKECPPVAPDNPIGPCIGVPVYATCTYGTYSCLCDWIHWLCI